MKLLKRLKLLKRFSRISKIKKKRTFIPKQTKFRTVLPLYDIIKVTDKTGTVKSIIAVESQDRVKDYNSWVKDLETRGVNYLRASIKNGI